MDRRKFLQAVALSAAAVACGRKGGSDPAADPAGAGPSVPEKPPIPPPGPEVSMAEVKPPPTEPVDTIVKPPPTGAPSEVYFTKEISPAAVMRVYEKIAHRVKGKVGLKVHFGEDKNPNYLKPEMSRDLALKLKATLVETNVLYVGRRRYTESHIASAREHGFTFAPIDILDSEGDKTLKVTDPRIKHYREVKVGAHMDRYDTFVVFSHFKGHGSAGFGGAIKNVAMGFSSIAGKMAQHANDIPSVDGTKCVKCMRCVGECPAKAITVDDAGVRIDKKKCIGCAKCIGECPTRVFGVPKGLDKNLFNERLVEYAKVISDHYPMVYISVMANISKGCDCARTHQKPFMGDVGILASLDMLAIDNAAHDMVNQAAGHEDIWKDKNSVSGRLQLTHGAEVGLGNTAYKLINLD
ncbi:MAG: hypothetical protein CVU65_02915 [Deltaproteobacteria bacterium HGW-Deltaproteobacteria-22]|jgi:hypothetical protein|nr:MAG: hypothetical protein CVU65_02915 [Deltaproteobacteria bacterium HGW-Deltaproteobacteria-22]